MPPDHPQQASMVGESQFSDSLLWMLFCTIALIFSVLALSSTALANSAQESTLSLTSQDAVYEAGPLIEYLEDESGEWTIEQVTSAALSSKFKIHGVATPNFGFTESAYWVRFTVENQINQNQEWLLELGYPLLDEVSAYFFRDGKLYRNRYSGDQRPFAERDLDYINFVFRFPMTPQERQTIYLRVKSQSSVQFPLRIYSPTTFAETASKNMLIAGIYYGILLIIATYNLFLYMSVRETSYLYYVLYTASLGLSQFTVNGHGYQHLWPEHPWWGNQSVVLFLSLSMVFAGLFTQRFLQSEKHSPVLHKVASYFILPCYLVGCVLALTADYSTTVKVLIVLVNIATPIFVLMGVRSWMAGYAPARYFTYGWAVLMFFSILWNFKHLGIVPSNNFTIYSVQIGSSIEVLLLSLALGDRIKFERSQTTKAQQLAVENLQKSNELKNSFMATVSHELRTPMNGIIGSLELIESAYKNKEPIEKPFETAENSAQHMQSLVEDILCFTDAQANNMVTVKENFHLKMLLDSITEHYSMLCKTKGLELEISYDDSVDKYYLGDERRLRKILSHLLDNAVKFTPEGKVSLLVERNDNKTLDPHKASLHIQVKDTGIGISEEQQAAVYDAFRQADGSLTRGYGGLGIGLAICHSLVKALEGTISFTSSKEGTQFDALIFMDKGQQLEPQTTPLTNQKKKTEKVMIVEDNPVNQMILCNLVSKLGHEIVKANNGQEAVDLFREKPVDFIFMDCQMPVMDGYRATTAIRDIDKNIPIVAVTANALERDRQKCFEAGMNDFISKPIKKGIIAEMLNKWGSEDEKIERVS